MKPAANMVMVFMPHDDFNVEHEHTILSQLPLELDSSNYMCAARIHLEDMESSDPGSVASFYLLKSCEPYWHKRGMRMLQHLDIITVGLNTYVLLDKHDTDGYALNTTAIPGLENIVLGGPLTVEN
jgi:hypothetical protein